MGSGVERTCVAVAGLRLAIETGRVWDERGRQSDH